MAKDDATWLNVSYVAFALLSGFFFFQAVQLVGVQTDWIEKYEWFAAAATVLAAAFGIGLTIYLKSDKDRHEYLLSSITELRKVSWPTWADTKRMTLIVVVVCGIFAVIVGVFDVIWAKALNLLLV